MKKSYLFSCLAVFGLTLAGCSSIDTSSLASSDNSNTSIVTSSIPDVSTKEELSVESIHFVDDNFEPIDYCFANDDNVNVLITLNNPNSYELVEINGNQDYELNKIDANNYYVNYIVDSEYGVKFFCLNSVSYLNGEINKEIQTELKVDIFSCKEGYDKKMVEIETADQLLNMNEGCCYELKNDIDLSGTEWSEPGKFSGVFNGNNHSISNLKAKRTNSDSDLYLGLFSQCDSGAVIFDLNIEKASFEISLDGDEHCDVYCGGLIGKCYLDYISIKNCNVNIDIKSTNNTGGDSLIGGLVGKISNSVLQNDVFCFDGCSVTSNMYLSSATPYANVVGGGIVGWLDNRNVCSINKCAATNIVTANKFDFGGIVGFNSVDICQITGCSADSIIKTYGNSLISIGGLAAYHGDSGISNFAECKTTVIIEFYEDFLSSAYERNKCSVLKETGPVGMCSGGMVGYLDTDRSGHCYFTDCTTTCSMSASQSDDCLGGLVGESNNWGTCSFIDCSTTSIIEDTYGFKLGGMIGDLYNAGTCYFTGCIVKGNLTRGYPVTYLSGKYSVENCTANITIEGIYINSISNENTIVN